MAEIEVLAVKADDLFSLVYAGWQSEIRARGIERGELAIETPYKCADRHRLLVAIIASDRPDAEMAVGVVASPPGKSNVVIFWAKANCEVSARSTVTRKNEGGKMEVFMALALLLGMVVGNVNRIFERMFCLKA